MASRVVGWPEPSASGSSHDGASFVHMSASSRDRRSALPIAMSYSLPARLDSSRSSRDREEANCRFAFARIGERQRSRQTQRGAAVDAQMSANGYTMRGMACLASGGDRYPSPPTSPLQSPARSILAIASNGGANSIAALPSRHASISSLRAVNVDPMRPLSISGVSLAPGHMSVSFQCGRVLCVFDAATGDLSAADEERLRRFVRRECKEESDARQEDTFMPSTGHMLALRTVHSTIVAMIFIDPDEATPSAAGHHRNAARRDTTKLNGTSRLHGVPLRLLIVQQNATYLIWEYASHASSATPHWQHVARGVLPTPVRARHTAGTEAANATAPPTRIISKVAYHDQSRTVAWFERLAPATAAARSSPSLALCTTQLSALADATLSAVMEATTLTRTGYSCSAAKSMPVPALMAAQRGFFVAPAIRGRTHLSDLYYVSLQTHQLVRLPVTPLEGRIGCANDDTAAVFAVHPHSRQLYCVDSARRLLSFREIAIDDECDVREPSNYVHAQIECVLCESTVASKPTNSASHHHYASSSTGCTLDLPAGSHLAVFRHYLCLMQPTNAEPTCQTLHCSFFTLIGGLHLSSMTLDARDTDADEWSEEPPSPMRSPHVDTAPVSLVACTRGFGGGICAYTQRGIWCLRVGPISSQVRGITKTRPPTVTAAANGVASAANKATKELDQLVRDANTMVPCVVGLLPTSIPSTPVVAGSAAQNSSLPTAFSTLDSPLLTSHSSVLADALATPHQANIACRVLAPYRDSAATMHAKHHVGRLISKIAATADDTNTDTQPNRPIIAMRLAEDNDDHLRQVEEGASDAKEGECEGQPRPAVPVRTTSRQAPPTPCVYDSSLSPTDASWFAPLFPSLQSPALGVAIFHLATSVPCAFSQPGASARAGGATNPALIAPAFTAHTYDAAYERVMREQIRQYVDTMSPIHRNGRKRLARRACPGASQVDSSRLSRDEQKDDANDSDPSSSSSASSSGASTPRSTSPMRSPAEHTFAASAPIASAAVQSPRARVKSCFQRYTPLSLQTMPLIDQYERVMRALSRMRHAGWPHAHTQRQVSGAVDSVQEGEPSMTTHQTNGDASSLTVARSAPHSGLLAHSATYIPPLPSLHHQLSKATSNRLTHLASTSSSIAATSTGGDRSFTSLVVHDQQSALNYLVHLLGLHGLSGAESTSDSAAAASSTSIDSDASPSSSHRILPSFLFVNEETGFRKDLLASIGMAPPDRDAATSPLIHYPGGSFTSSHSNRLDALPYFETLVKLFDQLAPQMIVELVRVSDAMFGIATSTRLAGGAAHRPTRATDELLTTMEMEAHVERALRVLPPILAAKPASQSVHANDPTETGGETSTDPHTMDFHDGETSGLADDGSIANDAAQSAADQLRLDRIAARCSLLAMSGRPIEAVLLRLRMAVEEADSSQEEAAIQLAKEIVQQQEKEEEEEYQRVARTNGGRIESKEDSDASSRLQGTSIPSSSPTHALRAELFHILLTYWLQQQFRRQHAHARLRLSSNTAAAAAATVVAAFFPPLTALDERIAALMPARYDIRTYTDVIAKEKVKFEHDLQDHLDESQATSLVTPGPRRSPHPPHAHNSAAPTQKVDSLWPTSSPLMLPTPAMGTQTSDSTARAQQVDLPMSCLLPELRRFAEKARARASE